MYINSSNQIILKHTGIFNSSLNFDTELTKNNFYINFNNSIIFETISIQNTAAALFFIEGSNNTLNIHNFIVKNFNLKQN